MRSSSLIAVSLSLAACWALSLHSAATARAQAPQSAPAASATSRPAIAIGGKSVAQGDFFDLGGRTVALRTLETLPYVENKITQKYVFDRYGDKQLEDLRVRFRLDDVVAPGRDEFERQVLLMEWVNQQIEYGDPTALGKEREPQKILALAGAEQKLYCENFAALLIAAAASMGYVCRPVDIPTHSFTEMWSSQHRKWIMMDPTGHFWAEKDGLPLNIYEIRQDWFENGGKSLSFYRGRDRRKSNGRSFAPYHVLYYTLKREWLGNRPEGGAFVTRDQFTRAGRPADKDVLENPATDPYFPVNQAALTLTPAGQNLAVQLRTLTPNFKKYRVRLDGGAWADSNDAFAWKLHEGTNVLEAQSVNLFDVPGAASVVELGVSKGPAAEVVLPAAAFSGQGGGRVRVREPEGDMPPAYVHLWSTKGHWLDYAVEDAKAGSYDVTLTYATRFHPVRQLSVDGKVVPGLENFTLGPTVGWSAFSDSRLPVKVALQDGKNVLRLSCLDETSAAVSAIRLTAPGRKDIVIDATNLYAQGGGEVQKVFAPRGFFRQWDANGHWLEWTVESAADSTYEVRLRYSALYKSPRSLSVNGEAAKGLESFTMPLTGGWGYWEEQKLSEVIKLKKGTNVLRMTSLGGEGLNLAGIRLDPPPSSGASEINVDAVSFTGQGGGSVQVYAPSRHRSLYNWGDANGHWLEWTFTAPKEGRYNLVLRCASAQKSSREVRVNGEVAKGLESAALAPAGGWQAWRDVKLPAEASLKKGENVLRLTALSGGLNLDEIRLEPVAK